MNTGLVTGFVFVDRTTQGRISPELLATFAKVAEAQIRDDVAPAWGMKPVPVRVDAAENAQPGECVNYFVDRDDDVPDALAYHTEATSGVFFARTLVETILTAGGNLADDASSVLAASNHECVEAFIDPSVNQWCDDGAGKSKAKEPCDPVQDGVYAKTVDGADYPVPNFVTPAWFDPRAVGAQLDWVGVLAAPFTRTAGGYYEERDNATGAVTQVFGEAVPEWRRCIASGRRARARAR